MNCVNHADVPSSAFCTQCGRALCNDCTRNVRGSVYCEQCLAEFVARQSAGDPAVHKPPVQQKVIAGTNPAAAFVLGLTPGVGAIYNGEFLKAAIHVLIFGILVSIVGDAGAGGPLVGLAIAVFYIYMPFEAYYTAKKRKLAAEGIDLETPIDQLHRQFGEAKDKELWGGAALIVIGGLFLADNFDLVRLDRIGRLWPVVLIGMGVWMLKRFQEKT